MIKTKHLFFSILTLAFFYSCQSPETQNNNKIDSISFKIGSQSECIKDDETTKTETKAVNKCGEFISSNFKDDNLTIVVRQNAFCGSKFKTSSSIKDGKILLKAEDTSTEATRCMCNFDLTYNFSGVKNNSYTVSYLGKVFNADECGIDFQIKK